MHAETKERWVTALRSGQYKQGQRSLRKGDEYCCLGVFCDLFGGGYWEKNTYSGEYAYCTSDEKKSFVVPSGELRRQYQVGDEEVNTLISMNDNFESFEIIASYIETYL
jgi:hypothetical protein